jgi:ParB-like chromosome segregation protein Spo0J
MSVSTSVSRPVPRPVSGPDGPDVARWAGEPVVLVDLDDLCEGGSPRVAGVDEAHVGVLAEVLDSVPPICVHRQTLRVIDGVHRVRAARALGRTRLPARLVDGPSADAFVEAVRANTAHGLPLSLADRKAATTTILRTHPHWSDRMIAEVVGLSARTVAAMRTGIPAGDGLARTGRDGRMRPVDPVARNRAAARLLEENPGLSLRQVARLAGISPETARAVKARLARGEDPAGGHREPTAPPSQPRPDWSTVVRRLRADPSVRLTETGRALLRLMDVHAHNADHWQTIASGVPPHCRSSVAAVAGEFARAWHEFADQLARDSE